jgi:tetratricopeptide (TPR) repeat protein
MDRLWPLWYERDYESMLEILQQAPLDLYIMYRLGSTYRRMGDEAAARGYFEQIIEMVTPLMPEEVTNETHAQYAALLVWAHAGIGNVEETLEFADKLLAYRPDDRFTRPRNTIGGAALAYAWVGEIDRAMDAIEDALSTSVQLGEGWKWGFNGPGFRLDPAWDELRGNPRFEAMIARLEAVD